MPRPDVGDLPVRGRDSTETESTPPQTEPRLGSRHGGAQKAGAVGREAGGARGTSNGCRKLHAAGSGWGALGVLDHEPPQCWARLSSRGEWIPQKPYAFKGTSGCTACHLHGLLSLCAEATALGEDPTETQSRRGQGGGGGGSSPGRQEFQIQI